MENKTTVLADAANTLASNPQGACEAGLDGLGWQQAWHGEDGNACP